MNSGRKPLYTDRILVYGPSSMAVFKHKENRKFWLKDMALYDLVYGPSSSLRAVYWVVFNHFNT